MRRIQRERRRGVLSVSTHPTLKRIMMRRVRRRRRKGLGVR